MKTIIFILKKDFIANLSKLLNLNSEKNNVFWLDFLELKFFMMKKFKMKMK
jgi:hypothetical protein